MFDLSTLDAQFAATPKVATLAGAGGAFTVLGGSGATAADVDVLILLDNAGFTNADAAEVEYTATGGDVTDSDGLLVVYFDSTDSVIKMGYDGDEAADDGSDGDLIEIATLTGSVVGDLASFLATDFA